MRHSEYQHPYDGNHWVSTVGKRKAQNSQKEWRRNRAMAKLHNGLEEVYEKEREGQNPSLFIIHLNIRRISSLISRYSLYNGSCFDILLQCQKIDLLLLPNFSAIFEVGTDISL